jgi:TetR/AcrR family transcriptional regulator
MGIAERKEREKQQRRLEIISAAESVFFSKGFESSTMDDIAKCVELSKGTLYLYFKSKDELLSAIVQKSISKLHELFLEHAAKEDNGICKIRAIGEAFIRFYYEFKDYYRIMIYHNSHSSSNLDGCILCAEIDKLKLLNHNFMVDVLEGGIKDGTIRKDIDPNKTSLLLWAESMGVLQLVSMKNNFLEESFSIKGNDLVSYFFEFTYNALKS